MLSRGNWIFVRGRKRLSDFRRGLWPKWWAVFKLRRHPDDGTFKARVIRRLACDRRELLVTMVDKVRVRELVAERSSTIKVPRFIQVCNSEQDLDFDGWPSAVVIKPSHGSGAALFITKVKRPSLIYDFDPATQRLWGGGYLGALRHNLDRDGVSLLCKRWLESDYSYWKPRIPEWAYSKVPPRIIVEELIGADRLEPITECRVHCFGGVPVIARITSVVNPNQPSLNFLPDKRIVAGGLEGHSDHKLTLPLDWTPYLNAIKQAEHLAFGIDYVRVDFLVYADTVYFSELTPYANGGTKDFLPVELSRWLAACWEAGRSLPIPPHLVVGPEN